MPSQLPLNVVIPYAVLAIFAAQQKFCLQEFRGGSLKYELMLGYFMAATSMFGIGYLIAYGIMVCWWAPIVLFLIGLLAWWSVLFLERFIPLFVWGLVSFIAVPVCAFFLISAFP